MEAVKLLSAFFLLWQPLRFAYRVLLRRNGGLNLMNRSALSPRHMAPRNKKIVISRSLRRHTLICHSISLSRDVLELAGREVSMKPYNTESCSSPVLHRHRYQQPMSDCQGISSGQCCSLLVRLKRCSSIFLITALHHTVCGQSGKH